MSARYVQPLRILVQFGFLGFMFWIGFKFWQFVHYFRSGCTSLFVSRPNGIEGFLPISGLLGTASWFKGNGINIIHPAAVVIFLTTLVVSLLCRRSFCSWICPVAAVSECSWKAGFKLLLRNPRLPSWFDVPLRGIKYLLMVFFIYSVTVSMSSAALETFINSDYHKLADVRLLDFFQFITPLKLTVVLMLLLISLRLKNPFCRYICPYGALLGLVAIFSPIRVTRNSGRCVSCGVCSQICPTYIDVMHKNIVVSPECIGCWRCVSHCRFNQALSMSASGKYAMPGILFALLVVSIFWGGILVGMVSDHWYTSLDIGEYRRLIGR